MNVLRPSLLIVFIASVACPLLIWRQAQHRLDKLDVSIRQQAEELSRWSAANEQLSQPSVQPPARQTLSESERLELLGLRSEVGRLRHQTNLASQPTSRKPLLRGPGEAVSQPSAQWETAEREQALVAQEIAAMSNLSLGLQQALQRYAAVHTNQLPADLLDLRGYFSTDNGSLPGLYTFEFLDSTGPLGAPSDALVLRSRGEHPTGDGQWMRLYGFADGRIVQTIAPDGDFGALESQHKVWPPQTNRTFLRVRQSP